MGKVTGLGGVFYKVADPEATKAWYKDKLGIGGDWGVMFAFKDDHPDGFSLLTPFKTDSDKFAPSPLPFMINLRVDDLDSLLSDLEAKGVEVLDRQNDDYGRFAWIVDPDGMKIELYEQAA
ncbi:MAG TPA: VOC family protein [Sphingomicrobium sp.]|jgi:catechol 2,3-dioxygenase-like lactoylglutathione lyase family enzyme|nr:VOC family protein [Sphingomicrobium sp.]